ncbi:MAG TPA: hypothetical protein VN174_00225 [Candidatus Methanoperedens sp.]|nr:hypothetical protein [Candidatus Methanoperedens sp.]
MKDKRFPTILGIILLLTILAAGVYLSTKTTTLSTKASGSCEPINPQVANLTYGSFDFSFLTSSQNCLATLNIDNKIVQDSSTVSNTHYFKVTNLNPVTDYKFTLISGGVSYSPPEFSIKTTIKPSSSIPDSNLAWGRVLSPDLKPLSGAIVFLTIPGGQALSAFTNKDGNWNISFATSFKEDKSDWFNPTSVLEEDLIVYSPDGTLTQFSNSTDNNDPVPDIVVGQKLLALSPTLSLEKPILDSRITPSSVNISITSPKESESISTLRPDVFGQGPANATLKITLDNNTASSVSVANNNTWHWSPSQDLLLGPHKITLSYQGKDIVRNFSVVAKENSLSFTATPSATLIPTQIPSPPKLPTNIPTLVPTLLPTLIPTLKPTNIPTKIPTVRVAKPSTTSSLYESGETFPTYFLIILSSILFGVSLYYNRK